MRQRLIGVDLFRGVAVYAVVILHSDEGITVLPTTWAAITHFAGFAVPFFLATSFYFAISKLYNSDSQYPLKSRLLRLLIPYGFWSFIYLFYKIAKYLLNGEPDRLNNLAEDPLAIIFLGGAAFHLYFLPLLMSGTLLIKVLDPFMKAKINLKLLIVSACASLLAYQFLLATGNAFELGPNVAFQPLLTFMGISESYHPLIRLFFIAVAWSMRCLPYILIAMIFTHPRLQSNFFEILHKYAGIFLIVFLILNAFGKFLLIPEAFYEVAIGYIALFSGLGLSRYFQENKTQDNKIIKNVGLCSFGIYLIHLFPVEVSQILANKGVYGHQYYESSGVLLFISILSFICSWIATGILMKQSKFLTKLMFGS